MMIIKRTIQNVPNRLCLVFDINTAKNQQNIYTSQIAHHDELFGTYILIYFFLENGNTCDKNSLGVVSAEVLPA